MVNNFSVVLGQVFLGRTSTTQRIKCLAQGHKTVTLPAVSLELATSLKLYQLSHCDPSFISVQPSQLQKGSEVCPFWSSSSHSSWSDQINVVLCPKMDFLTYKVISLKITMYFVGMETVTILLYKNRQFYNKSLVLCKLLTSHQPIVSYI